MIASGLHALALALTFIQSAPQVPVRVACIGDSVTFGAQLADREHDAYPVQLAARLGGGFEVRAFAGGGCTLLRAADRPIMETALFRAALAWEPDVSVVILGANDTCSGGRRRNWQHAASLGEDALALVRSLHLAREGARVILCSPTPMFPGLPGLAPERAADLARRAPRLTAVATMLREAAAGAVGVEFLDLSRVLAAGEVGDGMHPTPFGAAAIADRVAEAIEMHPAPGLDLAGALGSEGVELARSEFYGFPRVDFALPEDGAACTLVAPHVAARGYPWIWRARFFGHEPALDLALLERGFHLAYCDVAEFYGAPAAVERWERFHALGRRLGLAERAVLEGMSRGGLAVFAFAAEHPEHVAAVYGDNPVCDFRSWPGGRSGKRSDPDWERCLAAWDLTEDEAWSFGGMPLDRLEPLARAKVPVMLVLGTADDVVPPAENGEALAARYRELGGPVQVWRKPGAGHHPHGLDPVAPLARALLSAAGFERNPATRAVPSAEYRGVPAGWGGGTWWDQLAALRALAARNPELRLAFLGDSLTQGLTGSVDRIAQPGGERAFDRFEGARAAVSLGLSGDRTEHLLYRIGHGALTTLEPEVIVLQIGANNVNAAGHTGAETAAGIAAVVELLRAREPQAKIVLCGPFPLGATRDDPRRTAIDRVHELVAPLGDERDVFYRDLRPLFLDEEGRPNARMAADHVHVSPAGQAAWLAALEPLLAELLDPR